MKDEIAYKKSKRLGHTRQHWDLFNQLSNWAVNEAGGPDKVFGTKPIVADYTPTNLSDETGKAVQSNLKNFPEIQALLEKILPGYGEMVKTGSANTLSLLRGEVPKDVQSQMRRYRAFSGVQGSGYNSGGTLDRWNLRDLGIASLTAQREGENSMQRWAGITQSANAPFTVTTPMQAAQTERNNLYKQATEQFKYNVAAAPDPGAAGIFNLQTALGSMAASYGTSSALNGQGGGGQRGTNYGVGGNWSNAYGSGSSYGNQPGQYYGYDWGRGG